MELESWFEILFMAAADTGVVGEVGRGAAGKAFQKEGSGGKEYEGRTGILGHFFLLGAGTGAVGKKTETVGFNHFSVAPQADFMPSRTRPFPKRDAV
jgi:hypothetical protein